MNTNAILTKDIMSLFVLVCTLGYFPMFAFAERIVNYDNHPDLEKAMQYDLMARDANPNKANRELAAKHYLAYFRDIPSDESFQKARVYARLGDIYYGRVDPRVLNTVKDRDRRVDDEKAAIYYRKVLELEPERVDLITLNARGALSSLGLEGEDRFDARLNYYEWLSSLNKEVLREKALPLKPTRLLPGPEQSGLSEAGKQAEEKKIDDFMNLIELVKDTTQTILLRKDVPLEKLILHSRGISNTRATILIKHYHKIINRFPKSEFAKQTQARLQEMSTLIATETIDFNALNNTNRDESTAKMNVQAGVWSEMFLPLTTLEKSGAIAHTISLPLQEIVHVSGVEIDSKAGVKHFEELGKGDLVWTGKLLFVRGVEPVFQSPEQEKEHNYKKKAYIQECTLEPNESLIIKVHHQNNMQTYRIKIKEILPDGIMMSYSQVDGEMN